MNNKKRIIEVAFPVDKISGVSTRQITGIHTWWARRPLGPSRAIAYASLVDDPSAVPNEDENRKLLSNNALLTLSKQDFISQLSEWKYASKPAWINQARSDILLSHEGKPPKVLDPFGGGGSIPLEAQRLGCETYSCDLNPVAVLIQKCTLEYPQEFGSCLYDDVKKWGEHILEQVMEELAPFYPKEEEDGTDIFAYIWARTVPCQTFDCNAVIPLLKNFWLVNKNNKKIALHPYPKNGQVGLRIVGDGYDPIPDGFDPSNEWTVKDAVVSCPICKSTISKKETRSLFQDKKSGEQIIVVVTKQDNGNGKRYRLSKDSDQTVYTSVKSLLSEKKQLLFEEWGFDPVPDETTPLGSAYGYRSSNYNFGNYGLFFNVRQQFTLVTFVEKIRKAYLEMCSSQEKNYSIAVTTYLGLWLNQIVDIYSNLCRWRADIEAVVGVFGRSGLPMIWNYAEGHFFLAALNRLEGVIQTIKHLTQTGKQPTNVKSACATNLPVEHYPDGFFDAVLTDPPYYNNIPYAYLSDFFYVWLKRSIGEIHPELFKTDLTPKDGEVVAYFNGKGGKETGKRFFEESLSKAFIEMHRVLKPNGIAVIVYAHKSTEGWETLINALLDSGLVITGAWPVLTETKGRLVAQKTGSLASSIYMVARKMERERFGLHRDVQKELEVYLKEKLFTLWEWGFSGADLFIAAIGSGIEVFGKYETVLDDDDNLIRADRMITDIREILERFDGDQSGLAGTQLTRFYLRWRWEYGEKTVIFNDARELALSLGIELTEEWGEGSFIQQEKTNVCVLGPHEREISDVSSSEELIDILHHALLLWRSGNRDAMIQCLSKEDIGLNELIWNVAQQISNALPSDSQERQWLEGWLADQETIQREIGETQENILRETLF